jgi:transposase
VINPLLAKKYSTANIRKVKTDQADAAVLAEISERERHLPPRFCLTTQDIALRQKVTLIAKLDQNLQSLQRTLGEVQRSQAELGIQAGPVQSDLKDAITKLKDNKYALEDELQKDIVAKHRGSEKKVELLTSVPGISPYLACLILQFFRLDVSNAKSWVGYAGLDISVHQSGKKCLPGRLAKRGDPYFRKRLFSAGWGAAMNDPDFRKYYDRLKANKRHHKEATAIIARKLLATAFTVLKSGNVLIKVDVNFLTFPFNRHCEDEARGRSNPDKNIKHNILHSSFLILNFFFLPDRHTPTLSSRGSRRRKLRTYFSSKLHFFPPFI